LADLIKSEVEQCFSEKQFLKILNRPYYNWSKTFVLKKVPRQRLIVSLGTYLKIPKEKRREVARIVKERLSGQQSLFEYDSQLIAYADKIVKKIQTEGKWDSVREQVCKFKKAIKDKNTAEIFIDDVQHGYDRELGPVLIGHCF